MDIQIASNFERLVFELQGRDSAAVRALIGSLDRDSGFEIAADKLELARRLFSGQRVDDARAFECMARVWRECGTLIDPHSAAGVAVAEDALAQQETGAEQSAMICLATAHPAKFPDAVEQATAIRPALPDRLADLLQRPEHVTHLPNDLAAVKEFVQACARDAQGGKAA
jgi:threonine synthase